MISAIILFIGGILLMIGTGIYSKELLTFEIRDLLILSVMSIISSIIIILI